MRDIAIQHDSLSNRCASIHKKRHNSTYGYQLDGDQLSLTQLGRNMSGNVAPKHSIKRIDRLLSSRHINNDRLTIYRGHAMHLCGANPMPIVLVDWADVREQLSLMTLRALNLCADEN